MSYRLQFGCETYVVIERLLVAPLVAEVVLGERVNLLIRASSTVGPDILELLILEVGHLDI